MNQQNIKRTAKHRILAGAALIAGLAFASAGHAGNYGNNCVPWKLSAHGGEGGVRTLANPGDFRSTHNYASGQFCGNGSVQVELSKRDPHTQVTLHVNGYQYNFGRGDRGNRHQNHWFRRYVTIDLPHQNHYNDGYSHKKKSHKPHRQKDDDYRYYGDGYGNNGYSHGYQDNDYYDDGYRNRRYDKRHGHKHKKHQKQNRRHKRYSDVDHPGHDHGYGIVPKPRLKIGSRKHRKAHKLRLPHRHKRGHVAYH